MLRAGSNACGVATGGQIGGTPSKKKAEAKKGSGIQVFARFRPQNSIEEKNKGHECVQFDQDQKTIAVRTDKDQDLVRSPFPPIFSSLPLLRPIPSAGSIC